MLDWRSIWVAVQAVRRRVRAMGRSLVVGMVGFLGVGLPETGCASFQVALRPLILLRQHPAEADHSDGGEKKAGHGGDGYAVADHAPAGAPENDVF